MIFIFIFERLDHMHENKTFIFFLLISGVMTLYVTRIPDIKLFC